MRLKENLSRYFKSKAGAYTLMGTMLTPVLGAASYTTYDVVTMYDRGTNAQSQTQMIQLEERAQDLSDMGVRLKAAAHVAQSQTTMDAAMDAADKYAEMRKNVEKQSDTLIADIVNNDQLTEEDMVKLVRNVQVLFNNSSSLDRTAVNDFMQMTTDHRYYRHAQECSADLKAENTAVTASSFHTCAEKHRSGRAAKVISAIGGGAALSFFIIGASAPLSNRIGNGISQIGRRRKSKLGLN